MKDKLAGKFIVLDGPDGCGKSTHTQLLAEWLQAAGVETKVFRDPGTTAIGEKIRQILLDCGNTKMGTRTELLLYMAARAQLWTEEISPALKEEKCVILDRWLSSTCAYQGFAGGFGVDKIIKIAGDCLERVWPDLTILLDVDSKAASTRLKSQLDRMEQKGRDYHRKVREGFLALGERQEGFVIIDASGDIETVHKQVSKAVSSI